MRLIPLGSVALVVVVGLGAVGSVEAVSRKVCKRACGFVLSEATQRAKRCRREGIEVCQPNSTTTSSTVLPELPQCPTSTEATTTTSSSTTTSTVPDSIRLTMLAFGSYDDTSSLPAVYEWQGVFLTLQAHGRAEMIGEVPDGIGGRSVWSFETSIQGLPVDVAAGQHLSPPPQVVRDFEGGHVFPVVGIFFNQRCLPLPSLPLRNGGMYCELFFHRVKVHEAPSNYRVIYDDHEGCVTVVDFRPDSIPPVIGVASPCVK